MLDEQTPKEQKFGLLYTASPVQIRALTEKVHNLLLGSLTLNESLIKLIRKRRKLLLNFSNPERSFKTKLRALRSHYRYFTELLCLASPVIFQQKMNYTRKMVLIPIEQYERLLKRKHTEAQSGAGKSARAEPPPPPLPPPPGIPAKRKTDKWIQLKF